jgi:hypothetical protein
MEVPTSHAEAEGRSSPISLTPARASFFEGCHRTISTKDLSYLSFFTKFDCCEVTRTDIPPETVASGATEWIQVYNSIFGHCIALGWFF